MYVVTQIVLPTVHGWGKLLWHHHLFGELERCSTLSSNRGRRRGDRRRQRWLRPSTHMHGLRLGLRPHASPCRWARWRVWWYPMVTSIALYRCFSLRWWVRPKWMWMRTLAVLLLKSRGSGWAIPGNLEREWRFCFGHYSEELWRIAREQRRKS